MCNKTLDFPILWKLVEICRHRTTKLVCREKYDYKYMTMLTMIKLAKIALGQLSGLPLESVSTYEECQSSGTGASW